MQENVFRQIITTFIEVCFEISSIKRLHDILICKQYAVIMCSQDRSRTCSEIGSANILLIASRLVLPGTTQHMYLADNNIGIANVKALSGTSLNAGKHPSFTGCCRHASSNITGLIISGSLKSATGGSLNAM